MLLHILQVTCSLYAWTISSWFAKHTVQKIHSKCIYCNVESIRWLGIWNILRYLTPLWMLYLFAVVWPRIKPVHFPTIGWYSTSHIRCFLYSLLHLREPILSSINLIAVGFILLIHFVDIVIKGRHVYIVRIYVLFHLAGRIFPRHSPKPKRGSPFTTSHTTHRE